MITKKKYIAQSIKHYLDLLKSDGEKITDVERDIGKSMAETSWEENEDEIKMNDGDI